MASVDLSPLCKLFFQHRAISNNMSREQSGSNYKTTATQGYSSKEQQQQQHSRSSSRDSTKTKTKTIVYVEVSSQTGKIFPGPWHSAPGVLSSLVLSVWCTDFHTFRGNQQNSCHTMGDKTQQEAGSWAVNPALMVSELSWWRYFFKLSNLMADSGPWYFQLCQGHSTLWMPQMPFQLWVLALISKKPPSCDKCLLRLWLPRDIPLS